MLARVQHHVPAPRQRDGREPLAHALGPRRAASHEHRHVGTQPMRQAGQRVLIQPAAPQVVERNQCGSRIGTAAAQPADGTKLLNTKLTSVSRAGWNIGNTENIANTATVSGTSETSVV